PGSQEPVVGGRPRTLLDGRPDLLICEWMTGPRTGSPVIPHRRTQDPRRGVGRGRFPRVHLPRAPVSRPETRLQPLEASRALPPTQGRNLLPPPIRPVPLCSGSVQGIPYRDRKS